MTGDEGMSLLSMILTKTEGVQINFQLKRNLVTHRIINSQLHDSSIINEMTHLSSDIYSDVNFLDDLD